MTVPSGNQPETELDWRQSLRGTAPRLVIGAVLGSLAFWLAFRGTDWSAMWAALQAVDYGWALLALATIGATLAVLTWRWQLLFHPDHISRGWFNLFSGVVVGQMLNIIVPARLGEVARAYAVGTQERLSKARVLVTIGLEKVLDLGMFAISVLVLLLSMSLPAWLQESGEVVVGTGLLAVGLTMAASVWGRRGLGWLDGMAHRLPAWLGQRLERYGHQALDGLSALQDGWAQAGAWALSLVILILSASTNYCLFLAFHLPLSPVAALFLLVVLQVGNAPPSLPGKLGVFHYLTVLALSYFSVDQNAALSYAFVLYAVAILPKIVLGAALLALWRYRRGASLAVRWS